MVVHGEDFIVVGCGDDLDWLSQELNEKLELVHKARLGLGYDSDATLLNRVVYNDSGLTWETRPTTRRACSSRTRTPGGASEGEPRRRQAEYTT